MIQDFTKYTEKDYCPRCGKELHADMYICPYCNASILSDETDDDVFICAVCGESNPADVSACQYCCSIRT